MPDVNGPVAWPALGLDRLLFVFDFDDEIAAAE